MLLVLNNILNIGITGITGKDLASKIIALLSDIFVCIKLQPTTHNTHVALLLLLENFLLLTTYEYNFVLFSDHYHILWGAFIKHTISSHLFFSLVHIINTRLGRDIRPEVNRLDGGMLLRGECFFTCPFVYLGYLVCIKYKEI